LEIFPDRRIEGYCTANTYPEGGDGNIKWIISIEQYSGNLRVFNPEIEEERYCSFLMP
jgi:hypothetical protein